MAEVKFGIDAGWDLTRQRGGFHKYSEGVRVDARISQRSGPSNERGDWEPGLLTCEVEGRCLNDGTPLITLLVRRESREREVLLRWNSVDDQTAIFRMAARRLLDTYELTHAKCDLVSETDCYAEQYGDGEASEHAFLRQLREVLRGEA